MTGSNLGTKAEKEIVALLCVGDAGDDAPIALAPLHGQPFLHHLVKSLERTGIKRFFVGVDTVPGALLSYCDAARTAGLDIAFVRNPGDLVQHVGDNALIWVQMADTLCDRMLLKELLSSDQPLLATVDEQAENQHFERIDLNSRWAGLCLLHRDSLASLKALPDGWDMGSALLRQALQDGVRRRVLAQKSVQSGALKKLVRPEDLSGAAITSPTIEDNAPKTLESLIFKPIATSLLAYVWMTPWSRSLVEWLLSAFALLSAISANLAHPYLAAGAAIVALLSAVLRKQVRELEYRAAERDVPGLIAWSLLAVAFGASLYHLELPKAQSAFLWLSALTLSAFARSYWRKGQFWVSSPLVFALAVLFGQLAALDGWGIRLVVLVELGLLLLSRRQPSTSSPNSDEAGLKPN